LPLLREEGKKGKEKGKKENGEEKGRANKGRGKSRLRLMA